MENQGIMLLPRGHNNFPVTNLKDMEICHSSVENSCSKETQWAAGKQRLLNYIRKPIKEQNKKCKKNRNHKKTMEIWELKNTMEEMGNVVKSIDRMDQVEEKNLWSRRQDLRNWSKENEKKSGKKKNYVPCGILAREIICELLESQKEKRGLRGRKLIYGNNGFKLLKYGERFDHSNSWGF